ncbi:hypothetical protein ONS95_001021 [Cadophora gregata]|uniref:uncharacterized protein n=1 Tax=Cadophora gregata TaxID=51156 RepID=UPI0026DB59B0|nr:uncharacterized protein ONS95_001021 [Cadophora gregata]KAK0129080.1 hypothetical protein ONS95_001021 [Cadophora gregata]
MFTTSHLKRKSKGRQDYMTPPMTTRSRSSSCSSFDEESYFSKTYVPLSSLPTPPPSLHSNISSRQQSPDIFSSPGEILDPELLGPAIHLTNLIPSSTSLTTASVPLVHTILTRADLPLETLAVAVCILDSLNSRFALQWRKGCPLTSQSLPGSFSPVDSGISQQHIDSVQPELVILGALILAVKFLDDAQQRTSEYATEWGRGIWTCPQINFTQRVILENLGYRLLPLWEESIILGALEDMERAVQQYTPEIYSDSEEWEADTCFDSFDFPKNLVGVPGMGKAVLGFGNQITPVETPGVENARGTRDVDSETKSAFSRIDNDPFVEFWNRTHRGADQFPVLAEPGFGI